MKEILLQFSYEQIGIIRSYSGYLWQYPRSVKIDAGTLKVVLLKYELSK